MNAPKKIVGKLQRGRLFETRHSATLDIGEIQDACVHRLKSSTISGEIEQAIRLKSSTSSGEIEQAVR